MGVLDNILQSGNKISESKRKKSSQFLENLSLYYLQCYRTLIKSTEDMLESIREEKNGKIYVQ